MPDKTSSAGLKFLVRPLTHPITLGLVGSVTVLLGGWIIGANAIANQGEPAIKIAEAAWLKQFPDRDYNSVALDLHRLAAGLGIKLYSPLGGDTPPHLIELPSRAQLLKVQPNPEQAKAWEALQPTLDTYLKQQLLRADDTLDPIPDALQTYLKRHQKELSAIRQLLKTQGAPVFATTSKFLVEGDFEFPLPSYLNSLQLHRLLLLEALYQHQQQQTALSLETLEATWTIGQPFRESPYLIGQLISIISDRYTLSALRKFNQLPPAWQNRLSQPQYADTLLTSLHGESIFGFNMLRKLPTQAMGDFEELGTPGHVTRMNPALAFVAEPVIRPWLRLSALETYTLQQAAYQVRQQERGKCTFNSAEATSGPQASWWNPLGQIAAPSFVRQIDKAERLMLDRELTQHILQVRSQAAQTQKWPPVLPSNTLKSQTCPSHHWRYQPNPDGTVTLSFEPQPQWLESEQAQAKSNQSDYAPLSYQFRR